MSTDIDVVKIGETLVNNTSDPQAILFTVLIILVQLVLIPLHLWLMIVVLGCTRQHSLTQSPFYLLLGLLISVNFLFACQNIYFGFCVRILGLWADYPWLANWEWMGQLGARYATQGILLAMALHRTACVTLPKKLNDTRWRPRVTRSLVPVLLLVGLIYAMPLQMDSFRGEFKGPFRVEYPSWGAAQNVWEVALVGADVVMCLMIISSYVACFVRLGSNQKTDVFERNTFINHFWLSIAGLLMSLCFVGRTICFAAVVIGGFDWDVVNMYYMTSLLHMHFAAPSFIGIVFCKGVRAVCCCCTCKKTQVAQIQIVPQASAQAHANGQGQGLGHEAPHPHHNQVWIENTQTIGHGHPN